jgi:hypothetical protein
VENAVSIIAKAWRAPCRRLKGSKRGCARTAARQEGKSRSIDGGRAMAFAGPTDLLFPKWQRELFNAILTEENLRADRDGRLRTAYSLRHTYICLRLLEVADIYQIAKNCRTSVEMIEKYCPAHLKTQLDASAINIMRAKPKKKPVPKKGVANVSASNLAREM